MNAMGCARHVRRRAFTLLEVMIACFVFFMVAFSVLELTTRSLAAAKAIKKPRIDPGMLAALVSTNQIFEEGTYTLDLSRLGEEYVGFGYRYIVEDFMKSPAMQGITAPPTVQASVENSLFIVTLEVTPRSGGEPEVMRTFFFRPGSPKGMRSPGGGF